MSESKAKPVTAGGGIVFRYRNYTTEPEVLMIYRNGCWDLPKGKLEEGESIEMCAAREVAEEVGSHLPTIVSGIGTTYHEYSEDGEVMGKTTHWYSMIFTYAESFIPQEKEGIEKVEWINLNEAIGKADYENLKKILREFAELRKA